MPDPLYLTFDRPCLALTEGRAELKLGFPGAVAKAGVYLVLDLWDQTGREHPNGHLGWWRGGLGGGREIRARLEVKAGRVGVIFDPPLPETGAWVNEDYQGGDGGPLALHLVLRRERDDELLSDQTLLVFRDKGGLRAFQQAQADLESQFAPPAPAPGKPRGWPEGAAVHIVAPDIWPHDAVGRFCLQLAGFLRSAGVACHLYATHFSPAMQGMIRYVGALAETAAPGDVLFVNYSTADARVPWLLGLPPVKILYYHGITPPSFFEGFNAGETERSRAGLEGLVQAPSFDVLAANSASSAAELARAAAGESGIPDAELQGRVLVCPPVIGLERWERVEPEPYTHLPDQGRMLLSVGRFTPHKKTTEILQFFRAYAPLDPESFLVLVGSPSSPAYQHYLQFIYHRDLEGLEHRVVFLSSLGEGTLKYLYGKAAAYISMSEHEGFGIPLADALYFHLPVFAFRGGAVPETLGAAGFQFSQKNLTQLAAQAHNLLTDEQAVAELVAGQDERLAALRREASGTRVLEVFQQAAGILRERAAPRRA